MDDLRQELLDQYLHGPDTYIGQLCLRASEEIEKLEDERHNMRSMIAGARVSLHMANLKQVGR